MNNRLNAYWNRRDDHGKSSSDIDPGDYVGRDADLLSLDGWELPADMTDEVRVSVDHLAPEAAAAFRAIKF
jgi:hypothetical protein